MATTSRAVSTIKTGKKINIRALASKLLWSVQDSLFDAIVTVAITGITLTYMTFNVNPALVEIVSGYYVAAMMLMLFIRIIHRFDENYTIDELAERVIEMESSINERLDKITRNI